MGSLLRPAMPLPLPASRTYHFAHRGHPGHRSISQTFYFSPGLHPPYPSPLERIRGLLRGLVSSPAPSPAPKCSALHYPEGFPQNTGHCLKLFTSKKKKILIYAQHLPLRGNNLSQFSWGSPSLGRTLLGPEQSRTEAHPRAQEKAGAEATFFTLCLQH